MKLDVVSFTGDSGLAHYAVSLARAMNHLADVRILSARTLPTRFDSMGFAIDRVFRRSRHYPIDIFRFLLSVLRRQPDWLHLQGPLKVAFIDGLLARALRRLGIHTAVTVHDVLPHYPRPWSRLEYGFYYRSFDKIIAHSHAARCDLEKLNAKGSVLVIPHGVYDIFDLTGIDKRTARTSIGGLSDADFVVLFFGHLEPRKGLLEFIAAAQMMVGKPGFKFLIAGSNDLAKHGQTFAAALEAAREYPNIVIHDRPIPFESVENYFSACDAVALPYLEGTTSGVLKLALAFAKPVVATRVGDIPEQLPPGAGLLIDCDPGLIESLVNSFPTLQRCQGEFSKAMAEARRGAHWPEIADSILAHLSSPQ